MSTDHEASAQNPPEDAASRAQDRDGRLYLLFLFLVIAVYVVIAYGIYYVFEALA